MAFKKKRGMSLDYNEQGFVYFTCANYKHLPTKYRKKIDDAINDVGGFDSEALRSLVLDVRQSVLSVSMEYCIGEASLNRLRQKFYKRAYEELTK